MKVDLCNYTKRPNEQITLACAQQKMNDGLLSQKRMMAKIERDLLNKEKPNKEKKLKHLLNSSKLHVFAYCSTK
jgi:hypothetical protein